MHRSSRIFVVLLALTLLLIPVLSASAAEKPVKFESVDVVVHTDNGRNLLIVSGQLPQSAKLPANVELAVPAGAELQWAGEILGGDVADDPSVDYKVETRDGNDIYSFTLKESRMGQIEALKQDLIVPNGEVSRASMEYTPAGDVPELRMQYRLSSTAQISQPAEGAQMTPGPTGYGYYSRVIKDAKAGEAQNFAFAFTGGATAPVPASGAPTQSNNTVVLVLVLGLSLAGMVLLLMNVNRKMALKNAVEEEPAVPSKPTAAEKTSPAPAQFDEQVEADDSDAGHDAGPTTSPASRRGFVVAIIVTALVAGALFAVNSSRGGVATGDTVEMHYATVDTCTTSNLALTPPSGGSVESDTTKILESLRPVAGVGNATLHVKESRIEVRYCSSSVSEAQLLAALNGAGYQAQPLAPSAEEIQQAVPAP